MKGTISSKNAITLEDPSLTYTMGTASGAANLFNTVYLKIGSSVMTWTPTATGVTSGTGKFLGLVTLPA